MVTRSFLAATLVALSLPFAPTPTFAQTEQVAPAGEIAVGEALPGAFLLLPSNEGPHPAIIMLGGSEGGDGSARRVGPRFIAQGYAILGLPYYSPARSQEDQEFPELPRAFADIAVDQAETARDFLRARSDIRAQDIGIWGVSKGAEFALLAGSLIDGFAAIAAIVPSDVVWEGWGPGTTDGETSSFSWRGSPLPFVPYAGLGEEFRNPTGPGGIVRMRLPHDKGRNANPDRAVEARIAVEAIDEPVFVAGGDADLVWNSGEMAQIIAERRAQAGLNTVSHVFTDAGHGLSGDGKGPPNRWASAADIEAQNEIWPALLTFFAKHLKNEPSDPIATRGLQ